MSPLKSTVEDIIAAIGTVGNKYHKLGFTVGPLAFDNPDDQVRQLIRRSFELARAKNVAVAFHIDDSMFWGTLKDLINIPKDMDRERIVIVEQFIELWAKELARQSIPAEKLYAHIAFTPQGLNSQQNGSYAEHVHFAAPEVAFSSYYRPGFSTYPEPGTFEAIYQELDKLRKSPLGIFRGNELYP